MPSYARSADANHTLLSEAARWHGWEVVDTFQLAAYIPGFPDAIWRAGATVLFVEYKVGRGKLTPSEEVFADRHADIYEICNSVDEGSRSVVAITRRWHPEWER